MPHSEVLGIILDTWLDKWLLLGTLSFRVPPEGQPKPQHGFRVNIFVLN